MKSKFVYLAALFIACLLPWGGFAFELRPQLGVMGTARSISYSPDGKYIASASPGGRIQIWEVSSGKEVQTLQGHFNDVYSVSYSPDGKFLISGSRDNTLKLWDVSAEKQLKTFSGHTSPVYYVKYSPDGKFIVSGSLDKMIKVWQVSSGKEVSSFSCARSVFSVSYSPDGKFIVSGHFDGEVNVWDLSIGKPVFRINAHSGNFVNSVSYSNDGKSIVSGGGDSKVKIWNASSGEELGVINGYDKAMGSPLGGYVATLSMINNPGITIWNASSGKVVNSFKSDDKRFFDFSYSPDGKFIVSSGDTEDTGLQSPSLKIWELSSGRYRELSRGNTLGVDSVSFDGSSGSFASSMGRLIGVWDILNAKRTDLIWTNDKKRYYYNASYRSDGKSVLFSSYDGSVSVFNLKSHSKIIDFSNDEVATYTAVYSPDGKMVASGGQGKVVRLWKLSTGKEIKDFKGHTDSVNDIVFSYDGKFVASSGGDGIRIWSVSSGKQIHLLDGNGKISYSPDGKFIASPQIRYNMGGGIGSSESIISAVKIWDTSTGKEIKSFSGHKGHIFSVAYSPDGKSIVSVGADRLVKIWDVASGKERMSLAGHSDSINAVVYSPDGKFIASASADGSVRLWKSDGSDSVAMVSSTDGEWLIYTDDGLFDASPKGSELVAAVEGLKAYSIEQLALKNNRPDKILSRMGLGTPELIDYYHKRYLERLKKAGLKEGELDGSFLNLPQSTITNTKLSSSGREASLSLTLEDDRGLKYYQVYVNGVARYEGFGKELSGTKQDLKEELALTQGENRIEVSALNLGGQESFRALTTIAGPATLDKDLYFVGFGVSDYADKDIPDLSYANKDAKELSEAFDKLQGYEHRFLKTYTNEQVTKESIQEAKALFKKARPQDTVVLFIAGHGLHDRDDLATYYYIIHDTQLDLAKDGAVKLDTATAVSFEEIEGLLSGIDAKQKLFLMDTCESGEREEGDVALSLAGASSRSLNARAIGVSKVTAKKPKQSSKASKTSAARPWLLERDRYIYQDLSKRTGAVVLSSSKGGEYSFESKKLENGLFTEALLKALSEKAADENKDGQLSTDELKRYVSQEVTALSGALQHPTVDRDNLYLKLSFVLP